MVVLHATRMTGALDRRSNVGQDRTKRSIPRNSRERHPSGSDPQVSRCTRPAPRISLCARPVPQVSCCARQAIIVVSAGDHGFRQQQFSFWPIWLPHRHGRPRTGSGDQFRPSIAAPCCGDGRNKSGHDVERPYRPTKTRIAVSAACSATTIAGLVILDESATLRILEPVTRSRHSRIDWRDEATFSHGVR